MLATLCMTWEHVDDEQWARLSALLHTDRLAPHGCLSWHSRRTGHEVRVSALWNDWRTLEIFSGGLLGQVVQQVGLPTPAITATPVHGVSWTDHRPRWSPTTAASSRPLPRQRAA